jgi:protein gp37
MNKTSIAWTDFTANPLRARNRKTGGIGHYCEKITSGCASCYASALQGRFGLPAFGAGQHLDEVELFLDEKCLESIVARRKPAKIFLCNMTDLFGQWVKDEWIDEIFAAMGACEDLGRGHVFQILTKRAERMHDYVSSRAHRAWNSRRLGTEAFPCRNLHIGVSIENQPTADDRTRHLKNTPATVRFLSVEPLLSPIDLKPHIGPHCACYSCPPQPCDTYLETGRCPYTPSRIHWVIVGPESGPQRRQCDQDWIRSIVGQCRAAGVACFVFADQLPDRQLMSVREFPHTEAIA